MYPSFLGPHVAANRVTVKGRRGSSNGSGSKVVVKEEEVKKKGVGGGGVSRDSLKVKVEKEAKTGASQVLVTQTGSLTQFTGAVRSSTSRGLFKHSSIVFYMVRFICLIQKLCLSFNFI